MFDRVLSPLTSKKPHFINLSSIIKKYFYLPVARSFAITKINNKCMVP